MTELAHGTINILESDGTLNGSLDVPTTALLRGKYWISFTVTDPNTTASLLYNDQPGPTEVLMQRSTAAWSIIKIGNVNATASIRIVTADEYHTIIAPGTYNLIGERYIILRCPEIEENSFRSLAYSNHFLGLAMFRLGVNGLSDNPVSHIKVPTREFHPIGKLSRLSFRFETINGNIYDFKVVKINEDRRNIVLSRRELIEAERAERCGTADVGAVESEETDDCELHHGGRRCARGRPARAHRAQRLG
jgi:hypothetical protein